MAGKSQANQPSLADRAGSVARMLFPNTAAAARSVSDDAIGAARKGDLARAAGAVARGVVTYPVAAAYDVVGRPVTTAVEAVPNFLGGIFGSQGSTAVPTTPRRVAASQSPRTAVDTAMQAGRVAQPAVTPTDRLAAAVDSILRGPFTLHELTAAAGALPAAPKELSNKNALIGRTAQLSQDMFASQVAQAQAQAAAGQITQEQAQAVVSKALSDRFQRDAGLAGFDPSKLALSQLMQGGNEEE